MKNLNLKSSLNYGGEELAKIRFDASLERARELKCGTLVIRLKDKFQDLKATNKFLEQNESAFLKMSGEIRCK